MTNKTEKLPLIDFKLQYIEPGQKTNEWMVWSPKNNCTLGVIFWKCAWRRYVFGPNQHTVYDADCLEKIKVFLFEQNTEHKQKLKERKDAKTKSV